MLMHLFQHDTYECDCAHTTYPLILFIGVVLQRTCGENSHAIGQIPLKVSAQTFNKYKIIDINE